MRGLLLLGSTLGCAVAHAQALPEALTETGHRYTISARLDPSAHTVEGEATIVWRNDSTLPQTELFLHLYLNAFASDDTVFMTESKGQLRGDRFAGRGHIDLHALRIGETDLLASADDELVPSDHTQLRVSLPRPVAPGESITLSARFTSKLPPVFARSGYHGDFHMIAQWFPKVARLEPSGEWATFPYHGVGEFYSDFATYDVTLDVPRPWRVAGTGAEVETAEHEGRIVRRFVATRVHDAAFAAAPWFRSIDVDHERPDGSSVHVRVFYPPGYEPAVRVHQSVVLGALRHYGRLLGEYPYAQLTVVVPPRGASGASGMEYPTLFVTAGPWFAPGVAPILLHEEVTAHELAHQWFQGLVASNEVEHPALDEGLTEWMTGDYLQSRHGEGRSGIGLGRLAVDGFELRRAYAMIGSATPPPGRSVRDFATRSYGRSVYGRTSVILETIARTWGRERLHRALGRYARRHRFGHPRPTDLSAALAEEYGEWMPRRVFEPALLNGAFNALHMRSLEPRSNGDAWETQVVADREGELPIPTRIELTGDDGSLRSIEWPGDVRRLDRVVPGHFIGAVADPDRHSLLDYDRLDDVTRVPSRHPRSQGTLFGQLLFFFQTLFAEMGP